MALTYFQTDLRDLSLLQTSWQAQLNPLLLNPLVQGISRNNLVLSSGVNTINHLLGRKPLGFVITDINASATIFRSQPFNPLTLTLTASANATVNLYVF